MSKPWGWLQRNHGPITALVAIGTLLLTILLLVLATVLALQENPHWIDPLVKAVNAIAPVRASLIQGAVVVVSAVLGGMLLPATIKLARLLLFGWATAHLLNSRYSTIVLCMNLLLEIGEKPQEGTKEEYYSKVLLAIAEVGSLAQELNAMKIRTPVPIDNELNNREFWMAYLPALSVAARKGNYQGAVEFAESYAQLVNEDPRSLKTT